MTGVAGRAGEPGPSRSAAIVVTPAVDLAVSKVVALWKAGSGEHVIEEALTLDWREQLGLPAPTRLFVRSVEVLRDELRHPYTFDGIVAAIARMQRSAEPVATVLGLVLGIALEQRLFTEVTAGRLPPTALSSFVDLVGANDSRA